ncbi:MAG: cytochrome c family protein, partial [bacterium]|nr:cytochrome c family protein [bacterium]
EASPGIQVALLGHTVGDGKVAKAGSAWTVSGDRLGKELGRLRLTLDAGGRVVDAVGELIPIPETLTEAGPVLDEVVRFNQRVTKMRYADQVRYRSMPTGEANFVGADSCLPCHPVIHQQWSNTSHAFALDTLVEDGYAFNPECVVCHVVGYGRRSGFISPEKTPGLAGVQCESCHGAAQDHVAGKPMKPGVPEEVCTGCHNDVHSPAFEFISYSAISNQCSLP